jgi:hypothetical protein
MVKGGPVRPVGQSNILKSKTQQKENAAQLVFYYGNGLGKGRSFAKLARGTLYAPPCFF